MRRCSNRGASKQRSAENTQGSEQSGSELKLNMVANNYGAFYWCKEPNSNGNKCYSVETKQAEPEQLDGGTESGPQLD